MSTASPARAAAARVRSAIDAAAAALERPDLDALLATEGTLTAAFADVSFLRTIGERDRAAVRDELLAAQSALRRARRLGASLNDFIGLSLQALGQSAGYDPARTTAVALHGRGLNTRV